MRFRKAILAASVGVFSTFGLMSAPANAGPYCNDIDVIWCVALYAIEKVDCKVNHNCQ